MKKSGKKSTDEGFDSEEIKMMSDDQDYNDEEFYPIFKWNKEDKGNKEDFDNRYYLSSIAKAPTGNMQIFVDSLLKYSQEKYENFDEDLKKQIKPKITKKTKRF